MRAPTDSPWPTPTTCGRCRKKRCWMSEWKFQRGHVAAFRFVRCGLDAQTGVVSLVYAFDDGPEMTETVTVPGAPFVLEGEHAHALEQALRLLHLIAGVSY